ncbi:phage tail protein [Pectobacterium carotovorum]|uniref:Phage tail protein n=1 Tax=Pectobacterium carotovorum subsp. carotovorum TaxID=555 RepID=A0AAI9KW85_PECCC|nr:phage tail protein [Pectobacterium carotovorum]GKX45268.1 hypothetical protein SOASR016_00200 [Pectobacterium carotovorum subsp. carotovorum]GLV67576.1 hypothetical protein Pcaca03_00200 [Pectobacterium carotovorum subsp. carotovorum]
MAMDIFAGANIKVELGTAGSTVSSTFEVIPEIGVFPTSGSESTVITVKSFNTTYDRKLLGSRQVPDITLSVSWLPDNAVHAKLLQASENQTRVQVRITYYENATNTTGYSVVYNGFISKDNVTGDKDQAVIREFTLAVDGKAVESKVLIGE